MEEIRVLIVPADPNQLIRTEDIRSEDLDAFRTLVGGNLEIIGLSRPECYMYVNEDGKVLELPFNRRATAILWVHNHDFIEYDIIVGDAYIVGPPVDGSDTIAPDELVDLLTNEAGTFYVETRQKGAEDWIRQGGYFEWYTAYGEAIELVITDMEAYEARVIRED